VNANKVVNAEMQSNPCLVHFKVFAVAKSLALKPLSSKEDRIWNSAGISTNARAGRDRVEALRSSAATDLGQDGLFKS
jgi:hypothetical protein